MPCRHIKAYVVGHHPVGLIYCPDCDRGYPVSTIINLRLEELRTFLHTLSLYPRPKGALSMSEHTYLLLRKRILQHLGDGVERTEGELRTLVLDSEDAQSVAIYLRARDDLARSGQITFGWPQKWRTAPQDSE